MIVELSANDILPDCVSAVVPSRCPVSRLAGAPFLSIPMARMRRVNPVFGDRKVLRAAQCLNAVVGMRWYIALEKVMFYSGIQLMSQKSPRIQASATGVTHRTADIPGTPMSVQSVHFDLAMPSRDPRCLLHANTRSSFPARSRLTRPCNVTRRSGRLSMNLRRLGSDQRI
jgi:hypothetical protein